MASESLAEPPFPSAPYDAAVDAIIGRRSEQQDAAAVGPIQLGRREALLLVVADGMGGHAGGRVASATAIEAVFEAIESRPQDAAAARLAAGLAAANRAIGARIKNAPELKGMGCTLVAAILQDRNLTWISVGDSLLMTAHGGELRRLNEDHSLAPVLDARAAAGEISETEALESPQRHMLRAALTGGAVALVDEGEAVLPAGALLFAATDGVLTLPQGQLCALALDTGRPADFVEAVLAEITRVMPEDQDNTTLGAARVEAGPAPEAADTRGGRGRGWRTALSAVAFLVMIAALALITLVVWQGRSAKPAAPLLAESPAPAPPPPVAPKTHRADGERQTFPVGALGPPRPPPPRAQAPKPPPRPARAAPRPRPAPSPASAASRKAMDNTVDQALQPTQARPSMGPSPD